MQSSDFFSEADNDSSFIAAIDGLSFENDNGVKDIIKALQAGADPLKKGRLNSVLTAAINYRKCELIDFIFTKYPKEHSIFSEHDTFIGNTPLSLAIKTGQYELAERLIDKSCDVNCKIGDGIFYVYPLHLCVFLLGTSGDDRDEQSLFTLIKLLIEKGANINDTLHWGQSPYEILMTNIQKLDFDLYIDNRNYFEFYLDNPFSNQDVAIGSNLLKIYVKLRELEEKIIDAEDQKKDANSDLELLEKLRKEMLIYEAQYPLLAKEVRQFIEFDSAIYNYKLDNMAIDAELREFAIKYATENPEAAKMADYFNRTEVYSFQELKQKFNEKIPEKLTLKEDVALTNAWYPYMPYALFEHCVWHRRRFCREFVTIRRNDYFESETGESLRSELGELIKPMSPTPK